MNTRIATSALATALLMVTGFVPSALAQEDARGITRNVPAAVTTLNKTNDYLDSMVKGFLKDYWRDLSPSERREVCYSWRNNRQIVEMGFVLMFPAGDPNLSGLDKILRGFFNKKCR